MSRISRRTPLISLTAGAMVAAGLLGACSALSNKESPAEAMRGAGSGAVASAEASANAPADAPASTTADEAADDEADVRNEAQRPIRSSVAAHRENAPRPAADPKPAEGRVATKDVAIKAEPPPAPPVTVAPQSVPLVVAGGEKSGKEEAKRDRLLAPAKPAPGQGLSGLGGASGSAVGIGKMQYQQQLQAQTGQFQGRESEINAATQTAEDRFSTFAVDVDTAAYSIARRTLTADRMPTTSLVRVEEMVNYFKYDYEAPKGDRHPFAIQADGARSPVDRSKHLLRVGLQARVVEDRDRLPANLVFLVDTSCSMSPADRLELAKQGLSIAVDHLGEKDKVAITTYAGGVSVVLPPTPANQKDVIKRAIASLRPGGGTAMESGLTLAYKQAAAMLRDNTITRIIVCSDGDANIGLTAPEAMLKQVAGYVSEGVTLSTIGFGDGNYKDATMENIANKGNGNYYYVDTLRQAQRVFGRDLTKMIQDVAQDVKIQIEFDPQVVKSYRLVGYENRNVADKDFRNDKVDAGEIGAGHQVTAIYELSLIEGARAALGTIRVRAKEPRGTTAKEAEVSLPVTLVDQSFDSSPSDFRFAAAVMGGGELLRQSPYASGWSYSRVISIISDCEPVADPDRAEFLSLMKKAAWLSGEAAPISVR